MPNSVYGIRVTHKVTHGYAIESINSVPPDHQVLSMAVPTDISIDHKLLLLIERYISAYCFVVLYTGSIG